MIDHRIPAFLAALALVGALGGGAAAAETEQAPEFSGTQGVFLTQVPPGVLRLGQRVLLPGDVLTPDQLAQVTFAPLEETVEVGYLPVEDGQVGAQATLSLRGRENKAPAAEDSALETYKNLANTAALKVTDPEGEPLTYTLVRQPRRGTVTIAEDGSFTYTPKKNKVGVDSFTYTAADPAGNVSREATVSVTILKTTAPAYTDTLGLDCRFSAEWMKNTGIFLGETVGQSRCFCAHKPVTRGEFTAMLVGALQIPVDQGLTYTGFDDAIPQWLQPYVAAAVRSGLTAALPDQRTFAPEQLITAREAARMTALAAGEALEAWSQEQTPLTRAQASLLLYEACGQSAG